jgi:hypothetical protein
MIDTLLQAIVNAYDSIVPTFGSPVVLLAISVTLVALAIVEIWVRKCIRPAKGAN